MTPPPKGRNSSPAGSSSSKADVKRKISFGPASVHKIRAENPPQKDMDVSEADAILAAMQDTPTFSCDNLLGTPTCSSTVSTSFSNDICQRSHTTFSNDIYQPYNIPLHFLYFRFPIPLHRTQRKKNHLQKRSSRRRPSRTGAMQLSTVYTLGFQSHFTGPKEKRNTCRKEAAGEDPAGQEQCRGSGKKAMVVQVCCAWKVSKSSRAFQTIL